jgi:Fe-S oxidoreductase
MPFYEEHVADMERCNRCSYCKFVPYLKQNKKEYETVCPSISRHVFHGYSQGGRLIASLALQRGRIDYTEKLLDMVYKCHMDGACDISCKNQRDMEPFEVMVALRAKCVEDGELIPAHMIVIDGLKAEDNMMLAKKADRGNWTEGLDVKNLTREKAKVLFHAGCRYSFDEDLWPILRCGVNLLQRAGVDLGIMGTDETCCGGRAYKWGYQGELTKYAEHNIQNWQAQGVKKIVTACSDCYSAFKVLYDKIDLKPEDVEIIHITEYLSQLIEEGKLTLTKEIPMTVTYHDPCNLGRQSEPWIRWYGKEAKISEGGLKGLIIQEPPKVFRKGAKGVYDVPRNLIRNVPGIKFVEMERIREYAWCCGSGGGVKEAYPDFASWTANERLKEAEDTGADAIVTACGWCIRNFRDAIEENGNHIRVMDIIELVAQSA